MFNSSKFVSTCIVAFAGITALATPSFADMNEAMKDSKYCNGSGAADPICMGPESMAQRTKMIEFTKEKAMENRTKYCQGAVANDPICDPKMMNDTTGYEN